MAGMTLGSVASQWVTSRARLFVWNSDAHARIVIPDEAIIEGECVMGMTNLWYLRGERAAKV
jgi:hypothetical protein